MPVYTYGWTNAADEGAARAQVGPHLDDYLLHGLDRMVSYSVADLILYTLKHIR